MRKLTSSVLAFIRSAKQAVDWPFSNFKPYYAKKSSDWCPVPPADDFNPYSIEDEEDVPDQEKEPSDCFL